MMRWIVYPIRAAVSYGDLWHDAREHGDRRAGRFWARQISVQWRQLDRLQSSMRLLRETRRILASQ